LDRIFDDSKSALEQLTEPVLSNELSTDQKFGPADLEGADLRGANPFHRRSVLPKSRSIRPRAMIIRRFQRGQRLEKPRHRKYWRR
jgi:hypothetical protein